MTDANKPENKKHEIATWRPNITANLPILIAMLGLIYGIMVMTGRGRRSDGECHDLFLKNKRELVTSIISARIGILEDKIRQGDSTKLKTEELGRAKQSLATSRLELNNLLYFNIDTSLAYFLRYFSSNRANYLEALQDNTGKLPVCIRDTCSSLSNYPFIKPDTLQIARNDDLSLMQYIDKYPQMGFSFFLAIAQMSLWFMIASLVVGAAMKTDKILRDIRYKWGNMLVPIAIPLLVTGAFAWFLYMKLIDEYVISDNYFMDGFNNRMIWYSVPGYLVTVLCFSIYLFLANKLELLNEMAGGKNIKLEDNIELQKQYKTLRDAFDFVFLCTTIILSVFVLWLGSLFTAVNNIEAIHFYAMLSGKPLLSGDFVYLTGLMHSLLLLMFYVPVRLQFNSLQVTKDQRSADAGDASSKKVIKTFWDGISTVLITASPFLTTVIQKLITGFINN